MMNHTGSLRAPDYDVIVIGSGPAGCAAAINARRQGLSVLMITAQVPGEHPGHQPSESLHPGISSLLRHLGAQDALHKATRATYPGLQTAAGIMDFSQGETGTHIHKSVFNHAMLDTAVGLRVDVLAGQSVTGFLRQEETVIGIETSSGRTLIAKYTIDASGHNQVAAKILDIESLFFSPPLLCWSGLVTGIPEMHPILSTAHATFMETPGGWTWLAPEPSNGSCTYTCLSAKGQQEAALPKALMDAGIRHPPLKSNRRWRLCAALAMQGLILCGDAAAVIDPAAGQGNLMAIYSGIKASETAAAIIRQPDDDEQQQLTGYSEWFRGEYLKKVQMLRSYYPASFIKDWPVPGVLSH